MDTETRLEERIKSSPKHIIARMQGFDVPKVIESTHPRFGTDIRFDYGFLNVALFKDGYSVLLFPQEKSDKYTIVEIFDPTNTDDAMEAEVVKMSNRNESVYGRVKETNMDYIPDWWIHRGELASKLGLGEGAYLFEVKE
ncbi:hypothetical protein KY346_06060 [Candidatus Woesearchaeota archaeon]|nr:hypothetical protein [Candidatus Woesearchaeota archaeon]